MNRPDDLLEEVGGLAAALCEGELTPRQAARLEQLAEDSEEARQYVFDYLLLHVELAWDCGFGGARRTPSAGRRDIAVTPPPVATAAPPRPAQPSVRKHPVGWRIGATAAAAALVLVAAWVVSLLGPRGPSVPGQGPVASLARTVRPNWTDGSAAIADGSGLAAGQVLRLEHGLAEVRFESSARVVLEGPVCFQIETANGGRLRSGSLVAQVPPKASGFTVRTPSATVVDRGTELGVAVTSSGAAEVHVFAGRVQVRPGRESDSAAEPVELAAGAAVRVTLSPQGQPEVVEVAMDSRRFVRALPGPNAVARLRALVAADPHLMHHYPFEGDTFFDKCLDQRGKLHLAEVSMAGGKGGGYLYEIAPGFDVDSNAVRTYRSPTGGNTVGVGLQSRVAFQPPPRMTVELLLSPEDFRRGAQGQIFTAVATGGGGRECGFCVAAVDHGRLTYRLARDAPWGPCDTELLPGDWYYVATTFRIESGQTIVNCYVANLSRGEHDLTWAVQEARIRSVPHQGNLGIGTGYDDNGNNAYPWCGILDEVAIYDAELPRDALEAHLRVLVSSP